MKRQDIVENELRIKIDNFADYPDGFSFTVKTELEAYKSAYKYRTLRTVVKYAPAVEAWLVQIYNNKER